ncbi:hypothetical protein CHELA1G11_70030 [Hyphomicrobiales bacterium]|nr:hypothetical protein CHELA1G2_60016 [Hyphomicrobiales bacterium]CAH1696924.1 hypothetical protein CHELA1G11_70030 [Hyphomicrobiales bacterium]
MTHGALDSGALGKLVRLLSSDHDGEVVNAARAIGRSLQAAGSDWHELADRLSGAAPTAKANAFDDAMASMNRYLNMKVQEVERENRVLRKWLQERNKEAEKRRKSGAARWGNLTRLERVAELDLIAKAKWLSEGDRAYVDRLRHCLFSTPHIQTEPGDARFFNRLMDKSATQKEPTA